MIQMNLFTKQRLIDTENKLLVTKGKVEMGGLIRSLGLKYTHYYI